MRRTMGAAILIGALGGATVFAGWWGRANHDPAVAVVRVTADTTRATATPSVPAPTGIEYLPDPLAFLSTAPADSLDLLPGVGPVLASRLVAARRDLGPFRSWDDVDRVRGIGPKTVERLKALETRP